ncbi:MAG: cytochrome P450 [Actinobacteria bacterium]|nr:cytochrome P450 [Actinomycetota bacterium]
MGKFGDTRLPPGPKWPRLAQGLIFLVAQRQTARMLQRRYGDAVTVRLPVFGTGVLLSDPELIKQTFTASPDVLYGGEGSPLGNILGPGSFFSLDGPAHLRQRKLLLPPFHGERMQSYEAIIEEESLKEMATWPEGQSFATAEPFMRITLNAILRAVFGAQGRELDAFRDLLPRLVTLGSRLTLLPIAQRDFGRLSPWTRFKAMRREYDELVGELIATAQADPQLEERADVLALMLRARYDDGSPMEQSDIADQLLTILLAGHETTAATLAWAVERLRRHPDVLRRLVEETDAGGSELRQATIYEVQRVRPVITGASRLVKEPFELGEWLLPRGSTVIVAGVNVHNDPRIYDRPGEFDPDRFVGQKPDTYKWIPFGGGTRRCIGAAFANMEMDIVLRTLLREFTLEQTGERPERQHHRGVAFVPAQGGRAIVTRRRSGASTARSGAVAEPAVASVSS